jgi:hypothetical protein
MTNRKAILLWTICSIAASATAGIAMEKSGSTTALSRLTLGRFQDPVPQPVDQRPLEKARNLSLQPEAFKLGKRLGTRFTDSKRPISVATGTLTFGGNSQALTLTRRQNQRGEQIEIALSADQSRLTWDEADGAKATNRQANETERDLIERLTLDSPDQFVLAQLRGASYYTVSRNVRPAEAGDSDAYNGPLWTIVRIDEPDAPSNSERRRTIGKSRFYYLNEATGLIDKIRTDVRGEQIEASLSGWTSLEGETIPAHIVWTRNGQPLMEFTLSHFVRAAAQ